MASVHIVRLSKREIVGSLSSVYFCDGDCVEVGGQGILSCHTAATACGWQSGLVGTKEDQPHQSLRIQVHQRASQVDKDGKALSAEFLHGQQIISEPFCIH